MKTQQNSEERDWVPNKFLHYELKVYRPLIFYKDNNVRLK